MGCEQLPEKTHIIVFGNEKGGTGKSTVCMHVLTYLLRLGYTVGSIDVDARQGTLTRYIENRQSQPSTHKKSLPMPVHISLDKSSRDSKEKAKEDEERRFKECIQTLKRNDFIIIDTPGNDTHLSRVAHSYADRLITPFNDSFVDLDLLVRIDKKSKHVMRPSTYSEMVWEQKKQRLMRDKVTIDWIILRNRLTNIHSRNKQEIEQIINTLSDRLGFRIAPGFTERVIFRELFLAGLTLFDIKDTGGALTISHVAARQELRNLIRVMGLPNIE
jgi:chromosome partitioning protein